MIMTGSSIMHKAGRKLLKPPSRIMDPRGVKGEIDILQCPHRLGNW